MGSHDLARQTGSAQNDGADNDDDQQQQQQTSEPMSLSASVSSPQDIRICVENDGGGVQRCVSCVTTKEGEGEHCGGQDVPAAASANTPTTQDNNRKDDLWRQYYPSCPWLPCSKTKTLGVTSWIVIGHLSLFAVWVFLVVFGNVEEAAQMRRLRLMCDEPSFCAARSAYSADGRCCVERGTYQNAYKILSVVGGTLAAAHVAWALQQIVSVLFRFVGGVLYIFNDTVRQTLATTVFVGVAYVYQHLVYYVFFCHLDGEACAHPAREEPIIRRLFYSLLALGTPYLAVQLGRIVSIFLVFVSSRARDVEDVIALEGSLMLFSDEIESTFSDAVVARYRNVRTFLETWMAKNDEDVSGHLQRKARRIFDRVLCDSKTSQYDDDCGDETADNMEEVSDGVDNRAGARRSCRENDAISFARFAKFVEKHRGVGRDEEVRNMWDTLTKHEEKKKKDGGGVMMTREGLEDMLYDLFFRRKELIHSIFTDHNVITYLANVAIVLQAPASFIAVARIWGYQNSFGNGVDLFKTYVLSASYILTSFKDNIAFMVSMITRRPFNVGDVLQLNDNTYKVRRFSLTHLYMDGPHYISVPNTIFSSDVTINLTKQGITDSLQINVPLSTDPRRINRDRIYAIMHAYQAANRRDIDRSSIRCGWSEAADGATKMMQINWRYKFRIFDRSRLNWARANVRDHIMTSLEPDMREAYFAVNVAGGGGFNSAFPDMKIS